MTSVRQLEPESQPPAAVGDFHSGQYEVEKWSARDVLENRLYQARGLSMLIYGEGLEHVLRLRSDLREGVLWTLASLIDDALVAANRLDEPRPIRAGFN